MNENKQTKNQKEYSHSSENNKQMPFIFIWRYKKMYKVKEKKFG